MFLVLSTLTFGYAFKFHFCAIFCGQQKYMHLHCKWPLTSSKFVLFSCLITSMKTITCLNCKQVVFIYNYALNSGNEFHPTYLVSLSLIGSTTCTLQLIILKFFWRRKKRVTFIYSHTGKLSCMHVMLPVPVYAMS